MRGMCDVFVLFCVTCIHVTSGLRCFTESKTRSDDSRQTLWNSCYSQSHRNLEVVDSSLQIANIKRYHQAGTWGPKLIHLDIWFKENMFLLWVLDTSIILLLPKRYIAALLLHYLVTDNAVIFIFMLQISSIKSFFQDCFSACITYGLFKTNG